MSSAVTNVELKGRVICVPEEMHRLYGANLPERHEHVYGFRSEAGSFYSMLRTPMAEALFTDTNLHSKTLLLKGRLFPNSHILEVAGNLRSVRDGKVQELYYYCDVCAIKGSTPGPCMCCRDAVRLVEEPANE